MDERDSAPHGWPNKRGGVLITGYKHYQPQSAELLHTMSGTQPKITEINRWNNQQRRRRHHPAVAITIEWFFFLITKFNTLKEAHGKGEHHTWTSGERWKLPELNGNDRNKQSATRDEEFLQWCHQVSAQIRKVSVHLKTGQHKWSKLKQKLKERKESGSEGQKHKASMRWY